MTASTLSPRSSGPLQSPSHKHRCGVLRNRDRGKLGKPSEHWEQGQALPLHALGLCVIGMMGMPSITRKSQSCGITCQSSLLQPASLPVSRNCRSPLWPQVIGGSQVSSPKSSGCGVGGQGGAGMACVHRHAPVLSPGSVVVSSYAESPGQVWVQGRAGAVFCSLGNCRFGIDSPGHCDSDRARTQHRPMP